MSILVYHGAADTVRKPLVSYGRPDLDFGQGFYVTTLRCQAERWAQIVNLRLLRGTPCLNIYEIDIEPIAACISKPIIVTGSTSSYTVAKG